MILMQVVITRHSTPDDRRLSPIGQMQCQQSKGRLGGSVRNFGSTFAAPFFLLFLLSSRHCIRRESVE